MGMFQNMGYWATDGGQLRDDCLHTFTKVQARKFIRASSEQVWSALFVDQDDYRQWASILMGDGAYFEGDWTEGSEIFFYGSLSRVLVAKIVSCKKPSKLVLEYVDVLPKNGEYVSAEEKQWIGLREEYSLSDRTPDPRVDNGMDWSLYLQYPDFQSDTFNKLWPQAMDKAAELAERKAKEKGFS